MKRRRLSIDTDQLTALARMHVGMHLPLLAHGWELTGTKGLWLTRAGTVTARFVYRRGGDSVVFTVREIGVQWA